MITSNIESENENSITIKFLAKDKEYFITVIKVDGYTSEEILNNWTRRAKIEYMLGLNTFKRMFINRLNTKFLRQTAS